MFAHSIDIRADWEKHGEYKFTCVLFKSCTSYNIFPAIKNIYHELGFNVYDISEEFRSNYGDIRQYTVTGYSNKYTIPDHVVIFDENEYDPYMVNDVFGSDSILITKGVCKKWCYVSPFFNGEKDFKRIIDTYKMRKIIKTTNEGFSTIANNINNVSTLIVQAILGLDNVMTIKYPEKIIFNGDTTICIWEDGSKTFVKRHSDDSNDYAFSATLCILKKHLGDGATAKMHNIFNAISEVEKSDATNKIIKLKSNGNVEGHN